MLLSRVAAMHTISFYADCVHTLYAYTIFGREINVASEGIVKDTDNFSLYDKAHKDGGKVATSDCVNDHDS